MPREKEKIEFSSTTPSFIQKLLKPPVQEPVIEKEPVDDGPVIVNETLNSSSQIHIDFPRRENKIIEIGAQKLKKIKVSNSKINLAVSTSRNSAKRIEKPKKKSINLLSFDQEE